MASGCDKQRNCITGIILIVFVGRCFWQEDNVFLAVVMCYTGRVTADFDHVLTCFFQKLFYTLANSGGG